MKLSTLRSVSLACSAAACAWLASVALPGDTKVEYTFREAPIHAFGVKSLADLRGKPVLIDYWGTHCPPCVGAAVPASVKMQEELGDDLQVIFVESQGADRNVYEAFAWKMKWMGNNAMWTEERPVPVEGDTIPKFAFLGSDGTVLLTGNPLEKEKQIKELVAEEIEKGKAAPAGTPKALSKAWKSFLAGDTAGALAECDKLATTEAKALHEEFLGRVRGKIERARWLVENGFVVEADELAAALEKSAKGVAELSASIGELTGTLASEAVQSEREAAKALASLQEKIAKEKPFDEGNVKKAEAIAEKFQGTKSAERAQHFVELSKIKLEI
jgi:thiol-disulfide isomerase/thioredoxin